MPSSVDYVGINMKIKTVFFSFEKPVCTNNFTWRYNPEDDGR